MGIAGGEGIRLVRGYRALKGSDWVVEDLERLTRELESPETRSSRPIEVVQPLSGNRGETRWRTDYLSSAVCVSHAAKAGPIADKD